MGKLFIIISCVVVVVVVLSIMALNLFFYTHWDVFNSKKQKIFKCFVYYCLLLSYIYIHTNINICACMYICIFLSLVNYCMQNVTNGCNYMSNVGKYVKFI